MISAASHGFSSYQADLFDADIDAQLGKAEGYCLNQAIFSFLTLLLISGSLTTLQTISGAYDISPFSYEILHTLALLSLLAAFGLFVAIYFEQKLAIKAIVGISGVIAILSLIFCIFLVGSIHAFLLKKIARGSARNNSCHPCIEVTSLKQDVARNTFQYLMWNRL